MRLNRRVIVRAAGMLGLLAGASLTGAQPINDACGSATPVTVGVPVTGTLTGATNDGASNCNLGAAADVYHTFTTPVQGVYTFSLCSGTAWDSVLSLHTGCPAGLSTLVGCDDEGCRPPGSADFGYPSSLVLTLPAGVTYTVRISTYDASATGDLYTLTVVGPSTPTGACCASSTCSVQTQAVCVLAGGDYRGNYTTCTAPAGDVSVYFGTQAPIAIPDNLPAGISDTITVNDVFTVSDVRLEANLVHGFVGDLTMTLTHGGRSATIMQRVGGGSIGDDSNLNGLYTFTDTGVQTIWAAAIGASDTESVITPNVYRAADQYANTNSLRAAFAGLSSAGTWTLNVSDNTPADTGFLNAWRLVLDRSAGDPCSPLVGACCIGSSCQIVVPTACTGFANRFIGSGAACNASNNATTPCCRADFNQNGQISVQDIFDFLGAYFAQLPSADYNANGLSLQDLFDFLGGFFGGCG